MGSHWANASQPVLLDPLPRRVRVRLAYRHARDGLCIWLAERGRYNVARSIWRVTGAWR